MKEKAALAIAALMLASLAMGITIEPAVAQGVSVFVEPSYIPAGPTTLKVTVTNNTGRLANGVVIEILKDGTLQDWGLAGLAIIPKGENVIVTTAVDNNVFIAVDNVFKLQENIEGSENYEIPDSTELLVGRVAGYKIYVEKLRDNVTLGTDNLRVRPRNNVRVTENIENNDNLAAPVPLQVWLKENKVAALENIRAYWVDPSENKLAPIENALLKNLGTNDAVLIVSTENRVKVIRAYDNLHLTDNRLVAAESKWSGTPYAIYPGDNLELTAGENGVYLPAGSILRVAENVDIELPENLVLIRPAENSLIAENKDRVVTLPAGWSVTTAGQRLTFWGVGDNIPDGQTRVFEFVAKPPSTSGKYTVRVTLFYGDTQLMAGTTDIEVDATPPSVKSITATPQWAKANTEVTLEFEFSETVIVENITLKENNGNEVTLSLTPVEGSENKKWTATYTTGENKQRDGPATITIVKVKDKVRNPLTGQTWDNVLFIDRVAPPAPDTTAFYNWFPATGILDKNTQFIRVASSNIKDNYPFDNENPNTVDKVIIRVGASTYEMTKDIFGNWQYLLSFTADGVYEVGVYAIDKAGNVGKETAENIVVDTNKPSVEIQSPENNKYIKDNTPLLKVLISDLGCGLENQEFEDTENKGVTITLELLDGTVIAKFNPKDNAISFSATEDNTRPSSVSPITGLAFENTWPIELPDNTYILRVVAGDTLRLENVSIRFTVDTKAPNPPADLVGSITAGTLDSPTGTKTRTFTLRGTAEPGATIKVYITTDGGVTWTEVTASRTTAGADGSWLTQIDLSAYAGRNIGIAVTATDRAGNESDRTLYGYLIYDASAPRVTITSPQTGAKTSKTSIQVTGTVTKDSWEEWSDIILTIQVGTGSVTLPVFGTGDTANFSYSVALAEGTNTIMVIVSDGMNSSYDSVTVTRTVTPWGTYAVVLVIIALILAAIAILRVKK